MCILCLIQKWSRRVATMLPWLVIPLIGFWALSQLLPPPLRFEITPPRLACMFVLLVTLFWYEVLMPQLSAWRVKRSARLREKRRFEAIEFQKLRKSATKRCRNCLTPYRDQNPCGGKFMCFYCGHISKRPVLDLPTSTGMELSNSGILKNLISKGAKSLNGKLWSDGDSMCGQEWLGNGDCVGGCFSENSNGWGNIIGGFFGSGDSCFAEKSCFCITLLICKGIMAIFFGVIWICRKIFRVSSTTNDASVDAEHRAMLAKRCESGSNCHVNRGEKARRKAEEKRQARLEKELLEEEERKQREEVARLVEERRRQRDEKLETEKDNRKESPPTGGKHIKKQSEKKCQEKKKEKDKGSYKASSDADEPEKRIGKENEQGKHEAERREQHKFGLDSIKADGNDIGHGSKGGFINNHTRGNAGSKYFDRVKGTFLSSSRAFNGNRLFGKGATVSATVSRDFKSNGSIDHVRVALHKKEFCSPENTSRKLCINGEEKSSNRPVLIHPQTSTEPKKSWDKLFPRSTTVAPRNLSVISRPNGKPQAEVGSSSDPVHLPSTQVYSNPISFGLPSPFNFTAISHGSANSGTEVSLPSESPNHQIGEGSFEKIHKKSENFEGPCYIPDRVSLFCPTSETLEICQPNLGYVRDAKLDNQHLLGNIMPLFSDVHRPLPIESPMSRLPLPEERHSIYFPAPSHLMPQNMFNLPKGDSNYSSEEGTWQMWSSNPLGQDGLGFVGTPATWQVPSEFRRSNTNDLLNPVPQKTMASLFKKDDHIFTGPYTHQNIFNGECPNGGTFTSSTANDDPWFPNTLFGSISGNGSQFSLVPGEETSQKEMLYGSPRRSTATHPFKLDSDSSWVNEDWAVQQSSGKGIGNSSIARPHVGDVLYPTPEVEGRWL